MRLPGIPRRPRPLLREIDRTLSDHPVGFGAVDRDGRAKAQATVPRNELGRLIELGAARGFHALSMIGLHGVTRIESVNAKIIAKQLHQLATEGEPIDQAWLVTLETVARDPMLSLLVAAGQ